MATKKNLAGIIAEADAQIDAKADRLLSELDDANKRLPLLKAQVQDIEDGLSAEEEVLVRARNGEGVTGHDYAVAVGDDRVAKAALEGLTKRVNVLSKSMPVDTLILAEKTADVLRATMQGFNVYVTKAGPKTWAFPEDTTAIVVVAESAERDASTGLVSGNVRILFNRPGVYRPVNVEAFEAAAKAARVFLTVSSNAVGDEGGWKSVTGPADKPLDPNAYVVDSLSVQVRNVLDGHATIRKVDLSGIPARQWAELVYRSNGEQPQSIPSGDREWHWGIALGRTTVATGFEANVVSEEIDEDGIRTLVVTEKMSTYNTHPSSFVEGLREAISLDHGTTHRGMGVLVDSEVENTSMVAESQTANWTIRLTFVSKTA